MLTNLKFRPEVKKKYRKLTDKTSHAKDPSQDSQCALTNKTGSSQLRNALCIFVTLILNIKMKLEFFVRAILRQNLINLLGMSFQYHQYHNTVSKDLYKQKMRLVDLSLLLAVRPTILPTLKISLSFILESLAKVGR